MKIEVVFAKPHEQKIIELELVDGSTVEDAVRASGLCAKYSEIKIGETPVGIYAERVQYETPVLRQKNGSLLAVITKSFYRRVLRRVDKLAHPPMPPE